MKCTLFYLTLFFLFNLCFADNKTPLVEYNLHSYPGCPFNSECDQKFGETKLAWLKIISSRPANFASINQFIESNGFPMQVWQFSKNPIKQKASFESQCERHRKTTPSPIIKSEIFIKSRELKNYTPKDSHYFFNILIRDIKGHVKIFYRPFSDHPIYLSETSEYYIYESEGHFLSFEIINNEKIKVIELEKNIPESIVINCPPELLKVFHTQEVPSALFESAYCRQIWNVSQKTYQTVLLSHSCNK